MNPCTLEELPPELIESSQKEWGPHQIIEGLAESGGYYLVRVADDPYQGFVLAFQRAGEGLGSWSGYFWGDVRSAMRHYIPRAIAQEFQNLIDLSLNETRRH
jgi:hypothetical protein